MDLRHSSETGWYEIKIAGHLGHRSASRFEGFSISEGFCGDGTPVTTLLGPVVDQSALHGLLGRIRDLGMQLRGVNRVLGGGPDKTTEPSPES